MVPLLTHPRLHALSPDPPATVSIHNLSTTLQHAGHDAWNRAHKPQPCLISASVAFLAPFSTAAATDKLGGDTVHYGMLSKAVLGCVQEFDAELKKAAAAGIVAGGEQEKGVQAVLGEVWCELTGLELDGAPAVGMEEEKPVLDLGRVRMVSVAVGLPKASLLGEGVRLTASAVFDEAGRGVMEARAMALEVTRLRVPTLVGVNANERLARQFVVATVTVEGLTTKEDIYTEIEGEVVKAMETSSFETLEALGARLAETVLASSRCEPSWQVCIRMEKPTAVPMADCPVVEVRATPESRKRLGGRAAGTF